MRILDSEELDFSDVLILPQRSTLKSRKDTDIERTFTFPNARDFTGAKRTWTGFPVIAANMLTGTFAMAKALSQYGMMTALHKHYSIEELRIFWQNNFDYGMGDGVTEDTFYTLGIRNEDLEKYNSFHSYDLCKPKFVCIDIANGHISVFVDFIKRFRDNNPDVVIMAGNVVTGSMTEELILAGADIVKVGIGQGANCTTRKMAGIGRPQLSALIECADHAHGMNGLVCSDGGIVQPADINIAFCAYADFVMIGTMFAGTDECDGEVVEHNGKFHKKFFGMSSNSAMETFGKGKESYKASEGRTTLIPCKGSVNHIAEEIQGATRSMLSYIGASKLKEASKRATLIRVNNRLNNSADKYTIGN
jgi:GMP reductase